VRGLRRCAQATLTVAAVALTAAGGASPGRLDQDTTVKFHAHAVGTAGKRAYTIDGSGLLTLTQTPVAERYTSAKVEHGTFTVKIGRPGKPNIHVTETVIGAQYTWTEGAEFGDYNEQVVDVRTRVVTSSDHSACPVGDHDSFVLGVHKSEPSDTGITGFVCKFARLEAKGAIKIVTSPEPWLVPGDLTLEVNGASIEKNWIKNTPYKYSGTVGNTSEVLDKVREGSTLKIRAYLDNPLPTKWDGELSWDVYGFGKRTLTVCKAPVSTTSCSFDATVPHTAGAQFLVLFRVHGLRNGAPFFWDMGLTLDIQR
jgi:hypothetical protein